MELIPKNMDFIKIGKECSNYSISYSENYGFRSVPALFPHFRGRFSFFLFLFFPALLFWFVFQKTPVLL